MRSLLIALPLLLMSAGDLVGQINSSQIYSNQYRPPGMDWHELQTDHFRIIYPAKAADEARRSAGILESHYPHVREKVGGNLHRFPVILNTESDIANGFVTPLNFRSEVEITPSRGKSMNPRSGDWLNLVLPHELVHALQMSVNPGGVTWLAGLFSPDLRRSIHTAAPVGVFEGVAVHYESHGPGMTGGRGAHPFFINRFRQDLLSGSPWSMGQLFHRSASTRPFDRHYAGSWEFIDWLEKQYGESAFREAVRFHYRWPLFGFGVALRAETGHWPRALYRKFIRDRLTVIDPELQPSEAADIRTAEGQRLDPGYGGPSLRRPLWLDNHRLLVHGSFYNAPTGFWIIHLDSGRYEMLLESASTDDYRYALSSDGRTLHFADLVANPRYDGVFRSRLHTADLSTGRVTSLKRPERLYAPDPGSPFLALQTSGTAGRLVAVDSGEGTVTPQLDPGAAASVIEVQRHPLHQDLIAVIARRGSQQALWISHTDKLEGLLEREPAVSFREGSLYDLAWHPEERHLLVTSDRTGVMDIYEYRHENRKLRQITRSRSNAFEASYSPDGDRIAYIVQEGSIYLPMLLDRKDFLNRTVPSSVWRGPSERDNGEVGSSETRADGDGSDQSGTYSVQPYRSGLSWLKPRTLLPLYRQRPGNGHQFGLELHSTDLLSRNTYRAEFSHLYDRYWFDLDYTWTGSHPGLKTSLFSRPGTIRLPAATDTDAIRLLQRSTGAGIEIPWRYLIENRTRYSSLQVNPGYRISRLSLYPLRGRGPAGIESDWLHTISMEMVFSYRLRQHIRDIQPSAGWVLFAQSDLDLNQFSIRTSVNNRTVTRTLSGRQGLRAGITTWVAPAARWNQSLRLDLQLITQTAPGPYSIDQLVSPLYQDTPYPDASRLGLFNTRYTVPLLFPDDGGFLVPVYLSNLYLVLFSQSVADLDQSPFLAQQNRIRTAIGAGIRTRIRLSNLNLDLGIGVGYEPGRQQWRLLLGPF